MGEHQHSGTHKQQARKLLLSYKTAQHQPVMSGAQQKLCYGKNHSTTHIHIRVDMWKEHAHYQSGQQRNTSCIIQ